MELSPFALSALAVEILLTFAGLFLLWRHCFSAASKAAKPASPLPDWNINVFHIVLLVWLVLVGGILVQLGVVQLSDSSRLDGTARQIVAAAAFQFGMLLGCLGFILFADSGKEYSLPRLGFLAPGAICFCIALPLIFAVGFAWSAFLNLVGVSPVHQELVDILRNAHSRLLIGIMVGLAVIVAPITEELVFRAGLFRFLRNTTPRWVALLVPALLFGALHGNLASFPQLVLLGIIFSLSYERTGNIAVPMLAHALFNLNTIVLVLAGIDA